MVGSDFTGGLNMIIEKCRKIAACISGWLLLMFFVSCGTNKPDDRDTPVKGTIRVSVDESFKPVIEQELLVHHSAFPNTHIEVSYKSEAACFRDLRSDSTRMILVARGLTKHEDSAYRDVLGFAPSYGILAYDAVAVIVNREATDSVFTLNQLRDILSGKNKVTAVMDGPNATSTVRYLQDSLLHGGPFGSNVVASKNSQEVIDVVSRDPKVIGFVGLSWVGDNYDPQQMAYRKKIRLALLQCASCTEKDLFAKPSQASISYGQYPLARPLYYILKENAAGLGTGFMNFMSLERGQLIFRRSFLVPAKMAFDNRKGSISEEAD